MADILSEDEINRLLNQISNGDGGEDSEYDIMPMEKPDKIDLVFPVRFSNSQLAKIKRFNENFYCEIVDKIIDYTNKDVISWMTNPYDGFEKYNCHLFNKNQTDLYLKVNNSILKMDAVNPYVTYTKSFYIYGNEKVKITVPVILINKLLQKDIHDGPDTITKYAADKIFFETIKNILEKYTDEKVICTGAKAAENIKEKSDYLFDEYQVIDFCFYIGLSDVYVFNVSMKAETLLKLADEKIAITDLHTKDYYSQKKYYGILGKTNISTEIAENLKAGDYIDFKTSVDSPLDFVINGRTEKAYAVQPDLRNLNRVQILKDSEIEDKTLKEGNASIIYGEGFKEITEKQLEKDSVVTLDSHPEDFYPLVYNNKIIAQVILVPDIGKNMIFKVMKVLESPIPFEL